MNQCNEIINANNMMAGENSLVQSVSEFPMVILLQSAAPESEETDAAGANNGTYIIPNESPVNDNDAVPSDVAVLQNIGEAGDMGAGAGNPVPWMSCAGVPAQDQLYYLTYVGEPGSSDGVQPMLLQVAQMCEQGAGMLYGDHKCGEDESESESDSEEDEDEDEVLPEAPTAVEVKKCSSGKELCQTIADDVHIETKLQVLDAMLPPIPRSAQSTRQYVKETGDGKATYACDLCGATFSRAQQYYGHLHSHSGERVWSCETCHVKLPSHSQLRKHEKIHLNLRPHVCGSCGLQFDRESQLQYHERRIHLEERPHRCQFCLKGFFKRSDLRCHLNIHLGIRKNICETCGRQFNHRSNLKRHSRIHTGIKPYVCSLCGLRFTQVNALNSHKEQHHPVMGAGGIPSFECAQCGKVLRSLAFLKRHIRLLHGQEMKIPEGSVKTKIRHYYCQICGQSFQFSAQLQHHEISSHAKETDFLCRTCGQTFEKCEDMKSHSCGANPVATDSEDLIKCDPKLRDQDSIPLDSLIEQTFLDWPPTESLAKEEEKKEDEGSEMVIYIRTEGQDEPTAVRIKYDTATYDESEELAVRQADELRLLDNTHLPEITFPIENSENVENDEGSRFSLLSVGSSSKSDTLMVSKEEMDAINAKKAEELVDSFLEREPLIIKSELDSHNKGSQMSEGKRNKVYTCQECKREFNKKSNYTQHLGLHFVDLKKYRCEHCDTCYAWKSSLNKHLQTAHGVNVDPCKIPCHLCSKHFSNMTQMQEHLRRDHYKERPHICDVCQKSFYKKTDLVVHLRTHSKERPYMCGTCGKSFSHLSHIIRHERIHSGIKPYTCEVCGRGFVQSTTLKVHRKRHLEPSKPKAVRTPRSRSTRAPRTPPKKAVPSIDNKKATPTVVQSQELVLTPAVISTVDFQVLELCKL